MTENKNGDEQVTFGTIQKEEMEEGWTENGRLMGEEYFQCHFKWAPKSQCCICQGLIKKCVALIET